MLLDQLSKAISFLTTDSRSVHRNGNNLQKCVDAVKARKKLTQQQDILISFL